jgi:hypothetical protein
MRLGRPQRSPDFAEKMELGVESVIQKVRNSRMKWKSHIGSIPEELIPKKIMKYQRNGYGFIGLLSGELMDV